jgi:hypothetical protein
MPARMPALRNLLSVIIKRFKKARPVCGADVIGAGHVFNAPSQGFAHLFAVFFERQGFAVIIYDALNISAFRREKALSHRLFVARMTPWNISSCLVDFTVICIVAVFCEVFAGQFGNENILAPNYKSLVAAFPASAARVTVLEPLADFCSLFSAGDGVSSEIPEKHNKK